MGQTSLHWLFFLTSLLCCTTNQDQHEVNAKLGEDATLPCRGHGNATIEVIKWNRTDLKSDDIYVFFFRDGRSHENYQHESYHGRVELRDPEMKDGDASVILKNVTFNDTGTYECRVREENETGKVKLISIINMTVTEPGHTAGHKEGGDKEGNVGLRVGRPVGVILLFLLLCGGVFSSIENIVHTNGLL
ncbi:coxsackievirus and adenovirus receptor homolog [Micropterus salmoides]|uniref:coxsackievirus and adenovirus receptor homolog n=1 Tax=Micropterus salmoides TaxID=27706 RepID=UPI0018EC2907|nr:coxsackievirus and adenovirus receptor homolog [Micropterus salmoides]